MEEKFSIIQYVLLAPDVLVPVSWPIHGKEAFVLNVLRRIIRSSQQVSPIIKLNDIPVRLIRNHSNGFPFVCELLPSEQVVGGDVYEIFPLEDENGNVIEVTPGSLEEKTFWAQIREPMCVLRAQVLKLALHLRKFTGSNYKQD